MKTNDLVLIEWEDSAQPIAAWQFASQFDDYTTLVCRSVGWLVHDGDEVKGLAANVADFGDDDFQMSGLIRIPTRCVRSVSKLPAPTNGQEPSEPAK